MFQQFKCTYILKPNIVYFQQFMFSNVCMILTISPVLNNYNEQNKIIYSLNEHGNKTVNTGIGNVNGQIVLR